jgi:integrase
VSIPGRGRERIKLSAPDGRELNDKNADRKLAEKLTRDVSKLLRAEAYQREETRLAVRTTVEQFGELWTTGELHTRYGEVRGLRLKLSAADDGYRLRAHVYPHIGHKALADVTEQDVERLMARAAQAAEKRRGRPWRQATKFQLYQVLKRLFDLAIKPGRLRTDNPVSVDLRPRRDAPKLYGYLYPDEFVALLGCTDVPLVRRVHYALAVYTGLRKGSLRSLTCGSVDPKHCTLTSLESKTGLPQIFEIPAGLATILKRWYEHSGSPARSTPLVTDLACPIGREAEALRADLKAAGVEREMLFTKADQIERLRFHDMRATFVTWARRAGKGRGWITDRTGHVTDEMMRRYDRGARMLADLQYDPFPELAEAIPELSNDLSNSTPPDEFRSA